MPFNVASPAVPLDAWIVVSGATGFIGSHVVDQALAAGYRVRGTTRSKAKAQWAQAYFDDKYGQGRFTLYEVPEMAADNAFDEVTNGAKGFIHVANDMTATTDPNVAIPRAVHGAINALRAAVDAGISRFVFTSSSFAVTQPKPDVEHVVKEDTYNEEAVKRVREPGADGATVYSASKVEAEKALYKWAKEHGNGIVVNSICPNGNVGPVLSPENQGYPTSARWVQKLWDGDYDAVINDPHQQFINVQDDAKLHVIALSDPDVSAERIFGMVGPVSMQAIVEILRKAYPDRQWRDFPKGGQDLCRVEPRQRAEELLRRVYGHGYTSLEESVKGNAARLV